MLGFRRPRLPRPRYPPVMGFIRDRASKPRGSHSARRVPLFIRVNEVHTSRAPAICWFTSAASSYAALPPSPARTVTSSAHSGVVARDDTRADWRSAGSVGTPNQPLFAVIGAVAEEVRRRPSGCPSASYFGVRFRRHSASPAGCRLRRHLSSFGSALAGPMAARKYTGMTTRHRRYRSRGGRAPKKPSSSPSVPSLNCGWARKSFPSPDEHEAAPSTEARPVTPA